MSQTQHNGATFFRTQLIADVKAFDKGAKRGVHLIVEMAREELTKLIATLNSSSGIVDFRIDPTIASVNLPSGTKGGKLTAYNIQEGTSFNPYEANLYDLLEPILNRIGCDSSSEIFKIELVRNKEDENVSHFIFSLRGSNQSIYLPFREIRKAGASPIDFCMLTAALAARHQGESIDKDNKLAEYKKACEIKDQSIVGKEETIKQLQSQIKAFQDQSRQISYLQDQVHGLQLQIVTKDKKIGELEKKEHVDGSLGRFGLLEIE